MPGQIGYIGYIRVMAALPGTTQKLAAASGFEPRSTSGLLRSLWSLRLVHPAGTAGTRKHPQVVWAAGDGPNGTMAKCGPPLRPYLQHITFAYALRALENGATTLEVADAIGQSLESAQRLVRMLRQEKLLRIVEWRRSTDGKPYAVYEYGRGHDVAKPTQSRALKCRRYRAALRNRVIALGKIPNMVELRLAA